MIFRQLDSIGDWTFGKGLSNYARDDAAIGLNITTRILSWLGDCFFDQAAGIDWWNRMGSKDQAILLELDLRRIVLQSDGVEGILSFFAELNGRVFTVTYEIVTENSPSYKNTISKDF